LGERLAKGRTGSQQHECSHAQDDMHFFSRYSRLYVTAFVFIRAEISCYRNETDLLFVETSHYLLCTVHVTLLLLSGSITGLNKCDTHPRIQVSPLPLHFVLKKLAHKFHRHLIFVNR
jgi:hypothetical protein